MKTERNNFFTCYSLPDKERKNLLILDLVRKKGHISRTEISKITGINIVSVSNYITSYIEKNIVVEKGLDVSSGGRKPELVELNTDTNYIIGVDVGSVKIKALVTGLAIKTVEKSETQILSRGAANIAKQTINLVEELIKKHNIQKNMVKMIGIGAAAEEAFQLADSVEKYFGAETMAGPRAICAAYGENRFASDSGAGDLLYIHSDLGEGIVLKKDICVDAASVVDFPSEARYLSPWDESLGIARAAKREISKGVGTAIVDMVKGRIDTITQEAVINAASKNDGVALDIVQNAALNLGLRIAYLINLFNPQIIIIGGGIENAGKIFFDSIKKIVQRLAFKPRGDDVKIAASSLGEEAVSVGAGTLAAREVFLRA